MMIPLVAFAGIASVVCQEEDGGLLQLTHKHEEKSPQWVHQNTQSTLDWNGMGAVPVETTFADHPGFEMAIRYPHASTQGVRMEGNDIVIDIGTAMYGDFARRTITENGRRSSTGSSTIEEHGAIRQIWRAALPSMFGALGVSALDKLVTFGHDSNGGWLEDTAEHIENKIAEQNANVTKKMMAAGTADIQSQLALAIIMKNKILLNANSMTDEKVAMDAGDALVGTSADNSKYPDLAASLPIPEMEPTATPLATWINCEHLNTESVELVPKDCRTVDHNSCTHWKVKNRALTHGGRGFTQAYPRDRMGMSRGIAYFDYNPDTDVLTQYYAAHTVFDITHANEDGFPAEPSVVFSNVNDPTQFRPDLHTWVDQRVPNMPAEEGTGYLYQVYKSFDHYYDRWSHSGCPQGGTVHQAATASFQVASDNAMWFMGNLSAFQTTLQTTGQVDYVSAMGMETSANSMIGHTIPVIECWSHLLEHANPQHTGNFGLTQATTVIHGLLEWQGPGLMDALSDKWSYEDVGSEVAHVEDAV